MKKGCAGEGGARQRTGARPEGPCKRENKRCHLNVEVKDRKQGGIRRGRAQQWQDREAVLKKFKRG